MFEVEEGLLHTIANYLATKPYKEVQMMMEELLKLKKVEKKEENK